MIDSDAIGEYVRSLGPWDVVQHSVYAVVLCTVFTFAWMILYITYNRVVRPLYDPMFDHPVVPSPGLSGLFLGNMPEIMAEDPGVPQLRWAREVKTTTGFVVYRFVLSRPRLLCVDPTHAVKIMRSGHFAKPKFLRDVLRKVVGDGLLVSEGPDHSWQRKLIAPMFSVKAVRAMGVHVTERLGALRASLDASSDAGEEVDVHQLFTRFTLDVIGLAAFSHQFRSIESDKGESFKLYTDILGGTKYSFLMGLKRFFPPARLISTANERTSMAARDKIYAMIDGIVAKRRAELAGGCKEEAGLLDMMLTVRDTEGLGLTDHEVRNQVMTFLIAGHETTAVGLAWATWLLARHPEVLARLREEIDAAVPDLGTADPDSIATLPFLDACTRESLRLYPPAPILMRRAVDEADINGVVVAKGTDIVILPFLFHRDPEAFGDADEAARFDPSRWVDPSGTADGSRSFMPFWGGVRSCVGSRLAMLEMKAAIAFIVRRYDFRRVDNAHVPATLAVTMRPKNPIPMIFTKRV